MNNKQPEFVGAFNELMGALLNKASRPRVHRMHIIDAGPNPCKGPAHIGKYQCRQCGTETDWLTARTITEMKRGIPCERCNK